MIITILALILTLIILALGLNIKIEDNTISLFDTKIAYETNGNEIDISMGNNLIGSLTSQEKDVFDIFINELKETDMTRVFAFVEIALISDVAILFIIYFVLRYAGILFVNIGNNATPFTSENAEVVNKIAYLVLVSVIISFVASIVSSLFFGDSMISFSLKNVALVLVLYVIAYIFEYACILQKESKVTMYD